MVTAKTFTDSSLIITLLFLNGNGVTLQELKLLAENIFLDQEPVLNGVKQDYDLHSYFYKYDSRCGKYLCRSYQEPRQLPNLLEDKCYHYFILQMGKSRGTIMK